MSEFDRPVSPSHPVSEQYRLLRTRFDQLGYLESFSTDSVALLLRLLNDLIQTAESCKKLQHDNEVVSQKKQSILAQVSFLHMP